MSLPPQHAIAFLGTADPWSDVDAVTAQSRANGTPITVYAQANHSLETPRHPAKYIQILGEVMQKYGRLSARLCSPHHAIARRPTENEPENYPLQRIDIPRGSCYNKLYSQSAPVVPCPTGPAAKPNMQTYRSGRNEIDSKSHPAGSSAQQN